MFSGPKSQEMLRFQLEKTIEHSVGSMEKELIGLSQIGFWIGEKLYFVPLVCSILL